MSDRRYDEQEVAEIFRRAAEAKDPSPPALTGGEGLTLAALQEIGTQVGLPSAVVAEAARAIDRRESRSTRHLLGLSIGVGHTVDLGHRITDAEWDRLVVQLRETFDARGNVRVDGSLRQWTNGNLQVLVEPSADGDRINMRTVNDGARGLMSAGAALFASAGLVVLVAATRGTLTTGAIIASAMPLVTVGTALLGVGAARLRGWARLRARQMQEIAARLTTSRSPQ